MSKIPTQAKQLLKEVIGEQYFAVLNSVGNGQPYSNLISFAVTDDLKSLFFGTSRNTRKYLNIRENGNISLLIDNRTNQPSDISHAVAITVIGSAQEEVATNTSIRDIFLARHPQLRQFMENDDTTLILVNVRGYIIAGFDKTQYVNIR